SAGKFLSWSSATATGANGTLWSAKTAFPWGSTTYTVDDEPSGVVPRTSTSSDDSSNTTEVPAPGSRKVLVWSGPPEAASPDTATIATSGSPVVGSAVVTYSWLPSSTFVMSARPCAPSRIATSDDTAPAVVRKLTPFASATAM